MGIYIRLPILIGFFLLVLAGCGTSDSRIDPINGTKESEPNPPEDTTNEDEDHQNMIRILEQNIKYTIDGNSKEDTAFLKNSSNQSFSMYVLPEYYLSKEEPSSDVLSFTKNDNIFMRIELLPDNSNWDQITAASKAQLQAVNSDVKEVAAPQDDFFKNSTVMRAGSKNEVVTIYLLKNKDVPLKLSIFNSVNEDHTDPFLKMAKTIMKN